MKKTTLIASVLLGLGLAVQANAQNNIYITGSTAFRSVVFSALTNLIHGPGGVLADITTRGGAAASGNNGSYMLIHGTNGAAEYFVNCAWSGSEAGIASTAFPGANTVFFLNPAVSTVTAPYSISSAAPASAETNGYSQAPDLCLADTTTAVAINPPTGVNALVTLTTPVGQVGKKGEVGIVPFTWLKNTNSAGAGTFWDRVKNITDPQARQLLGGPNVVALLTTNNADTNKVYVVGRNRFSGTRVNTLAITRYGIFTPVDQFSIGGWPKSDGHTLLLQDNSVAAAGGEGQNDGYDGGGDVVKALGIDGSISQDDPIKPGNGGWMAIGYAGISDASNMGKQNQYWLTYNGVACSNTNIQNGAYTFWNHEYMYGKHGISGFQLTFGKSVAAIMPSLEGGQSPGGIDTSIQTALMHADKPSDTGDPSHF